MQTMQIPRRTSSRVISDASRKNQRDTYGTMENAFDNALSELAEGRLANAFALLREALAQGIRDHYLRIGEKQTTSITSPEQLLNHVRGRGKLDRWTFDVITAAMNPVRKTKVNTRHADILAGIVEVYCFDKPKRSRSPGFDSTAMLLPSFTEWL